jgi:CBS domain-containing protein/SAM-dependent methyltransferase
MPPTVRDAMSEDVFALDEQQRLADALDAMRRHGVGSASVIAADGSLVGTLVKRDGARALRRDEGDSLTVGAVCRRGLHVGLDDPLEAALQFLEAEQVGRAPVVSDGNQVGVISQAHIRFFLERHAERELEPHQRSRVPWRKAEPDEGLTWGMDISGEAFIRKAEAYGAFGPQQRILEIGPGYGRLLRECRRRKLPFRSYMGIDISPTNVEYLTRQFQGDDVAFALGDIETVSLGERFDVVLSSLTLKHLYPSFERALRNVKRHLNPGALLIFDVIEGTQEGFEPNEVTYVHRYTRPEIQAILADLPLDLIAFDEVEHDPAHVRLLVVARSGTSNAGGKK